MKGYGIEDLTTVVREIKNSEEKKNLYILLGVFIAVAAVAIGIAAILVKKNCGCSDDEFYDDWDTEDDFEDYEEECCSCGCEDDEVVEEATETVE